MRVPILKLTISREPVAQGNGVFPPWVLGRKARHDVLQGLMLGGVVSLILVVLVLYVPIPLWFLLRILRLTGHERVLIQAVQLHLQPVELIAGEVIRVTTQV
jgi:hypothetical protein